MAATATKYLGLTLALLLLACGNSDDTTIGDTCGGLLGLDCAALEYCHFEVGSCGAADQTGVCTQIPDACLFLYQPVCGCDGKNYGNDCEAAARQISIAKLGLCEG